jgi:hypothetical protein
MSDCGDWCINNKVRNSRPSWGENGKAGLSVCALSPATLEASGCRLEAFYAKKKTSGNRRYP